MDGGLHQRVCYMPTIQEPDTQAQDPHLPHPHTNVTSPLQTNRTRPYHRTTKEQRIRRHPNHSRPWMFESSHLPPMQNHYHRTTNRILIPTPRILLVWTPA